MKTVLVNYLGRKGAGTVLAYEASKALLKKNIEVVAVIPITIENINEWNKLPLKKLIRIKTYNNIFEFMVNTVKILFLDKKVFNELLNISIDCIYCPMIQPWSFIVNRLFPNTKKVVTVHDPKPHSGEENILLLFLNKLCIFQADEIIVLSKQFREYCAKKYKKDIKKIHVINHGEFSYYKRIQKADSSIKFLNENVNFLFFGRISQYKGLNVLAKAYRIVCQKLDNVTLTIAGSGDFSEFESSYNILPNVTVLNRWFNDNEVGGLFSGPNIIVVLPYLDASQSGVIPVAIEYDVPVIASNTGGFSEQIINQKTGILVSPNEPELLAEAMVKLAKNPQMQKKLTLEAKRLNSGNSWEEVAKKLINIFDFKESTI